MTGDGGLYEGYWKEGERNGIGRQVFPHKEFKVREMYTGEWKDDEKHGRGKYEWMTAEGATSYEGKFVKGKMHDDQCYIKFPDGSWYEGSIKNGVIEGQGTMHSMF